MKTKTIITILGIFLLVGGLGVGVYLVGQRQILTKKAAPASTIFVTPETQTKNPGDTFTFSVAIDTATNQVNGFDIRLTFDPDVIQITSLAKGAPVSAFTTEVVNNFDNTAGTVSFGYITTDPTKAVNGSGIDLLDVTAQVKAGAASGNTSIAFNQGSTLATDINETQNVLVGYTPGTLTVSSGASPTPTGSPTASPTGTPAGTPTPTGSGTPHPTATPTGTGSTSSIKVTSPASGSTVTDSTPTFKGTAPAGSTVTITIYSTPITTTVTADSSGNWQYTPTQTLADGSHTVSITASGTTNTATSSFTVQSGSTSLPVTGVEWPTVAATGIGLFVIIGSLLLAL